MFRPFGVPQVIADTIEKAVQRSRRRCTARVFVSSQFQVSDAQLLTLLRLEEEGKIEMAVI